MRTSGQLTFTTMGGETVTVPVRGKHYVQPKGYAHIPGTWPNGENCGSCKHIQRHRKWAKCAQHKRHTGGRGTDILVKSPACAKWEKPDA